MKHPCFAVLISVSLGMPANAAPPDMAVRSSYAFVDVNVIPMDHEGLLPHQTVLVSNGSISRIGPTESIEIPSDATIIRGSGRYLMPGLSDMHQHFLRSPEPGRNAKLVFGEADEQNRLFGLLAVANGVTTVRSLWGQAAIDKITSRFIKGELVGPTVYSSGPITDGDPPEIAGARGVRTPAQGRAAVREDKRQHREGVKVYDLLTLPVYDAILDEARRTHMPVWGHLPFAVPLAHAIEMRQRSIEHVDSLLGPMQSDPDKVGDKKMTQLVRDANPERLRTFAQSMKAADVWVCPTIVAYQMDWREGHLAEGMAYLSPRFMKHYSANWPVESTDAFAEDELRLAIAVVRVLHDEGVGILVGSDALKRNVVPGFALVQELEYLVMAGLRPYEALHAATANAARFLGRTAEFGTVSPGKRADLLLLSADPTQNIGNVRKQIGVMVRGRWFSSQALRQLLDEQQSASDR